MSKTTTTRVKKDHKEKKVKRSSSGLFNLTYISRMLQLTYTEQQYLYRTVYSNSDSCLTKEQFEELKERLGLEMKQFLSKVAPPE